MRFGLHFHLQPGIRLAGLDGTVCTEIVKFLRANSVSQD
jgi:hypothetical protein